MNTKPSFPLSLSSTTLSFFLSASSLLLSTASHGAADFKDMNSTVAIDIIAPISLEDDGVDKNKLFVRSAEIMFYGPLGPVFDAALNMAGHDENGEFIFSLHEGYISSSKLIKNATIKAGKFFLGAGRLNGVHQHDWPFITAPKVHREVFNPGRGPLTAEGAADSGLELSYLVPMETYLNFTLGVTNGYCFGHCHKDGKRPKHPVAYLRPTTFYSLGAGTGVLMGATYLIRSDDVGTKTQVFGIETTYKKRVGKVLKWLFQAESFYQLQEPEGLKETRKAGFYALTQYGFDPYWSFGVRVDGFSHLNMTFNTVDESREDFDYGVISTLTYKPSEFGTIRLAYMHEVDTTQGVDDVTDRQVQFQFTALLGAHPAHDF